MINDAPLMNFCRSLVDIVRSGLPINEGFEILAKSSKHGKFAARAAKLVADGETLHEALKAQKIFPPVFIALIRAGEEGGKVDEFLSLYADCLEVTIEFKRKMGRALVYPLSAVILGAAIFLIIFSKVFPLILGPLFSFGIAVPSQILWINKMANYLYAHWPLIILFVFMGAVLFRAFMRSGLGRKIWALLSHWLPGLKFAIQEARLYNLYTIMGILLKAGVPLFAMMDILLQFTQNDPIDYRHFSRMSVMVTNGKSFAESLIEFIPREDLYNLEIAEKAGRLDERLLRLGKNHYDRHLHRLKLIVSGFKISSMVVIAILTFGLLITLLRPVLSTLNGAQNISLKQSGFIMPPMQTQAGVSQESPLSEKEQEMYDKTARFNEIQGGKIVDLMKKSSLPKLEMDLFGESKSKEGTVKKKKLGGIVPMKTMQFKKIEPTSIKPANID
ncbi:MAG: type II secretion system F family protein [Elusimicrobiota bacterium]|nr:type II secretion system F family protein [Elusimicrobiota bacterium]